MNICLRIPWPRKDWPFIAIHCCVWGSQYGVTRAHRFIYRAGIGIGRVVPAVYKLAKRDKRWYPTGKWKWHYWNGAWK